MITLLSSCQQSQQTLEEKLQEVRAGISAGLNKVRVLAKQAREAVKPLTDPIQQAGQAVSDKVVAASGLNTDTSSASTLLEVRLKPEDIPQGSSLAVLAGPYTRSANVQLQLQATGASTVTIFVGDACQGSGKTYSYSSELLPWELAPAQLNTSSALSATFANAFGQSTACQQSPVIYDSQAPSLASFDDGTGEEGTKLSTIFEKFNYTLNADLSGIKETWFALGFDASTAATSDDAFAFTKSPQQARGTLALDRRYFGKLKLVDNAGNEQISSGEGFSPLFNQENEVISSSPSTSEQFARHLALGGDFLAVAAPQAANESVYLFKRDAAATPATWLQQASFSPLIAAGRSAVTRDLYASALSIDSNSLLVGAPGDDTAGFVKAKNALAVTSLGSTGTADGYTDTGAVYSYTLVAGSWALEEILKPGNAHDDKHGAMNFGQALVKAGELIAVGAPREDENSSVISQCANENEAYARSHNVKACSLTLPASANWNDQSTLTGENSGAVYVFSRKEKSSWFLEAYLKATDNSANAQFGSALAFDGSYLAAATAGGSGSVYLFKRACNSTFTQCWQQQQKLSSLDASVAAKSASSKFGQGLGLWDRFLAVADPTSTGQVFIYKRGSDEQWLFQQSIAGSDEGEYLGEQLVFSNGLLVLSKRSSGTAIAEVYIRDHRGQWQKKQDLQVAANSLGETAGPSLAVDGTNFRVAVGTWIEAGGAFIFE